MALKYGKNVPISEKKGSRTRMSLSDRLTCPFDPPHETTERPLGALELHMGLKSDAQHIAWRTRHNLPIAMNFHTIHKRRRDIRIAIIQDLNIFKPRRRRSP